MYKNSLMGGLTFTSTDFKGFQNGLLSDIINEEDGATSLLCKLKWCYKGIIYSFVSCLVAEINFSMVVSFFPIIAKSKGLDTISVGIIFASYQLCNLLCSFMAPRLIAKFTGIRMLGVSNFLQAIVTLGVASCNLIHGRNLFFIIMTTLRCFQGLLAGLSETSANYVVTKSVPEEHVRNAFAWNELARILGFVIGPLIGGLIHTSFGFPAPFIFVSTLLLTLCMNMALFGVDGDVSNPEDQSISGSSKPNPRLSKYPIIRSMIMIIIILAVSITYTAPSFQIICEKNQNMNGVLTGLIFSAFSIAFCLTIPSARFCVTWCGNIASLAIGLVFIVIAFFIMDPPESHKGPLTLFAFLHSDNSHIDLFTYIMGLALLGVGVGFSFIPITSTMVTEAEYVGMNVEESAAQISKITNMAFTAGAALGPLAGGLTTNYLGISRSYAAFAYFTLLTGMLLLLFILVIKWRRREIEEHSSGDSVSDISSSLFNTGYEVHEPNGVI